MSVAGGREGGEGERWKAAELESLLSHRHKVTPSMNKLMTETPLTETECSDIGGQAATAGIHFLSTNYRTAKLALQMKRLP